MDGLPVELLRHVLSFVQKRDVHTVAGVSKRMRKVARADDRFFLIFEIYDENQTAGALEYAVAQHIPLKVFLVVQKRVGIDIDTDFYHRAANSVVAALPLVTMFAILVQSQFWAVLAPMICQPAPLLRGCIIFITPHTDEWDEADFLLPDNLFSKAPRFKSVCITPFTTSFHIPVTFRAATEVNLNLVTDIASIILTRDFPNVRRLKVGLGPNGFHVDCHGAQNLQRLDLEYTVFQTLPHVTLDEWTRLNVSEIPIITLNLRSMESLLRRELGATLLQDRLTGLIALRADFIRQYITLGSMQNKKQLMIFSTDFPDLNLLLGAVITRLVDIDIDCVYLKKLFRARFASLPALERLRVQDFDGEDVFADDDLEIPVLQCNSLKMIVLVDAATPMFAVDLARSLGQLSKPVECRTRLTLLGDLNSNVPFDSLNEVYRSVALNGVSCENELDLVFPEEDKGGLV